MSKPSTDELLAELDEANQFLARVPQVQQRIAFINGVLSERGTDPTTDTQETTP